MSAGYVVPDEWVRSFIAALIETGKPCDVNTGAVAAALAAVIPLAVAAESAQVAALRAENAAIKAEAAECAAELAAYTRDLRAMAAVLTKGGEDFAALKREVERLRGALERIGEASSPWPPKGGQVVARNPTARNWRDRLDDIHDTTRAALAHKEPGDEG